MNALRIIAVIGMGLLCLQPIVYSAVSGGGGGGGGGGSCAPDSADPYGWTLPGDPVYGFGAPDPTTQDLVGLAAKGNIIIGDYTDPDFQTKVLPYLTPGAKSVTQAYVIDPSDASLGYQDYTDAQGRPVFDGNYDREDGGAKSDDSPRKFYESSLSNPQFQAYLATAKAASPYGYVFIEGVLYTNHALASLVKTRYLGIVGAAVARDEALIFQRSFWIDHDIRLLDPSAQALALPMSLKRPKLRAWKECPPAGCPSE